MTSLTSEQKYNYAPIFYSVLLNLALLVFATLMHSGAKQVTHSTAVQIKYLPGLTKKIKTSATVRKKKNKIVDKQVQTSEPDTPEAKSESNTEEIISKDDLLPDIVPLSDVTRMPQFLNRIEPYYPEDERNAGKEALVIAEIVVDTRGRILDVSIIKSGGTEFDQAVLSSLTKSSFVPGYIDGKPVVVRLQIPFRFNLR